MRKVLFLLVLAVAAAPAERVPVTVWPEDGAGSDALEAWTARIDGAAAEVVSVLGPESPLALLVVMDTVDDLNRAEAAREALHGALDPLPENWRVALLRAQDGLRVLTKPTGDPDAFLGELNRVEVMGFPGLLDAVRPAASIGHGMAAGSQVRVAVLFVTDGSIEDYRGDWTAETVNESDDRDLSRRFNNQLIEQRLAALADSLASCHAPLFFVHLEERSDREERAYQNGLREFARATGGRAYFARALADVGPAIRRALERIASGWTLRIAPTAAPRGLAEVEIGAPGGATVEHRAAITFGKRGACFAEPSQD